MLHIRDFIRHRSMISGSEFVARTLVLALLALALFAIGKSYIGDAPGPYGTCYGDSGRAIPCAIAADKR